MNIKFFVASYEVVAQAEGEALIVKLVKETEQQKSVIDKRVSKNIGIAGSMELIVYEQKEQERFKRNLGKEIEILVSV